MSADQAVAGQQTRVIVTVPLRDPSTLRGSVYLNVNGKKVGKLNDDGVGADATANDGTYSGAVTIGETERDAVAIAVSATQMTVRGLATVRSPSSEVSVVSSKTELNDDRDFYGFSLGSDGVSLYVADLPRKANSISILRSKGPSGPWTSVVGAKVDSLSLPLIDSVDATTSDFYYRLVARDSSGNQIKVYKTLFIPRYMTSSDETSPDVSSDKKNPKEKIYNQKFISDYQLQNFEAMTNYQVRDLLEEKGSFLKTDTVEGTIPDTDGKNFSPAQLIVDLAKKNQINPQLILVTMQKESLLVTSKVRPKAPKDGYMGVKDCKSETIRGQLACGVAKFRKYMDQLEGPKKTTSGGWRVGKAKTTCYPDPGCKKEKIAVTPPNKATAVLWTYTPVVGAKWGGSKEVGGTAFVVSIWYPTLFRNIVHILKWRANGVEVVNKGWQVDMGVADRGEADLQPSDVHGVSAGLPENPEYKVTTTCSLNTWDSYVVETTGGTGYWDLFAIGITKSRYWELELSDPIPAETAPVQYGGAQYDDGSREQQDFTDKQVSVVPADKKAISYLNVVLDTKTLPYADDRYPSWGTCKVKKVIPAQKFGEFGLVDAPE